VLDALLEVGGEEFEGTAKFCEMMDNFFDALNVTNYSECITSLQLFRRPYKKISWRMIDLKLVNA